MTRAEVAALLRGHRPADEAEAGHVDAMSALLAVPGDPFARDHFTPGHFTASAFVLSPDGGSLLLLHHAKLGIWVQPGGHVEPGDVDLAAAAAREVAEEVGLAGLARIGGLFDVDVHDIPARRDDPAHRHYDLRVLFRADSETLTLSEEAKAARWVPLADLLAGGDGLGTDASVLRAARKVARG